MRRFLLLCLIMCAVFSVTGVHAQGASSSAIEVLDIQFWPDFDQPAVLVLLTGTLSNPGTVTVPFPENGDFLVLARIDSNNTMVDDIGQPIIENGTATFTLPAPDVQFRLEYYVPYTADGNTRNFSYTWQADIPANEVTMRVQRPAAATSLTTVPEATGQVQSQNDGLLYYELPVQSAAVGQPLSLQVSYTMSSDALTVSTLSANPAPATGGGEDTAVSTAADINWGLLVGGLALVVVTGFATWQLATRQNSGRVRKPAPRRPQKNPAPRPKSPRQNPRVAAASKPRKTGGRFCHECGEQARPEDRFCRNCGTTLR